MQLSSGEDDVREVTDIEGILGAVLDTRKEVARGMRNSQLQKESSPVLSSARRMQK